MPFPILVYRFGVFHWQSFEFEDGTSKDKYFIAFNCNISDMEISIVLPTSRIEKYSGSRLIDTVLIKSGESQYFSKDTLIDLKNIKVYEKEKIENAINNGKVKYLGCLEDFLIERIEDAISGAVTLSQKEKKNSFM